MKRMLKLLCPIVILIATFSSFSHAQTESERLTAEALALVGKRDYVSAARIADQVVKIERAARNNKRLGVALVNLAQIKQLQARQQTQTSTSQSRIGPVSLQLTLPITAEIDSHYSEAVRVFETLLPAEASAWTTAVFSYGDFLTDRPFSLGYETSDFEKVENLYKNSLGRLSKFQGDESDLTLALILRLADLYQGSSEYERSFPYYQRFVKAAGTRKSDRPVYLVRPLREYVKLFAVSGQKVEAESFARQIAAITGKDEGVPVVDIEDRRVNKDHVGLLDDILTAKKEQAKRRSVWVNVVVDKDGDVVEAKSEPTSDLDIEGKKVTEVAERKVRSWKFRPLKLDGVRRETHGRVAYIYITKN